MAMRPMPAMMMARGPQGPPPPDDGGGAGDPAGGGQGPPSLPDSPVGGPGGPSSTPIVSPGNASGKQAAAIAQIKSAAENIKVAAFAFPVGSKELNACLGALRTLNPVIGQTSDRDLDPAARARMAEPPPSPLAGMAPPGQAGAAPAQQPLPEAAGAGGAMGG